MPHVSIGELTGFIERLYALGGSDDLYELARDLHMEADDILPRSEAADLLGLGDIAEGDVLPTRAGREFPEAVVLEEQQNFGRQTIGNIELLRRIERELHAAPDHRLREDTSLAELQRAFRPDEARQHLDTALDWGRYTELFAYDDAAGEFALEEDGSAPAAPSRG